MSSASAHPQCEQSSMSNSPPGVRIAATLIHPAATVASDNRIGDGVLLAAGARVTTNVTLGRHVHLNVNAVVSHDCVIGNYTTLSPGSLVNGDVQLEPGSSWAPARSSHRGSRSATTQSSALAPLSSTMCHRV